jgi:hypothetical protein
MNNKIESILIKATLIGNGIVNFDSNEQKWLWNKQNGVEHVKHNNVSFGKGRYYETLDVDGNKVIRKTAVISSDCLRHAMYETEQPVHMPNVMHNMILLVNSLANKASIERGWQVSAPKLNWHRKSSFTLDCARAIESSQPMLETYAKSSERDNSKDEEKSNANFFKREVRGDTKYELIGSIDTTEIGFIPMSEPHDRVNIHSDQAKQFCDKLSLSLNSEVQEPQFYQKQGDIYGIPEYGVLLTQEQRKLLILDILERLARLSIRRSSSGWVEMENLQIKLVKNPLQDRYNLDEKWITVYSNGTFIDPVSLEELVDRYQCITLEEANNILETYKQQLTNKK